MYFVVFKDDKLSIKNYLVYTHMHVFMHVCGRFFLTNIFSTTTQCPSVELNLTILKFLKFYFVFLAKKKKKKKVKVVFGWQHLDFKLMNLKCLDLISIDFKIPCLGLFIEQRILNSIVWIPKFGFGFRIGFKIIKYFFQSLFFLNLLHFNFSNIFNKYTR